MVHVQKEHKVICGKQSNQKIIYLNWKMEILKIEKVLLIQKAWEVNIIKQRNNKRNQEFNWKVFKVQKIVNGVKKLKITNKIMI